MKKILVLLLVLSVFTVYPTILHAQGKDFPQPTKIILPNETPPTGVNLTLSPVFINLSTDPGKKVTSQFKVTNNNNFTEYLEIEIKKFVASEKGPVIQDSQSSDTFVRWVTFPDNQFVLSPNETKTIRFTISPPNNAALGYYYAFVVSRMRAPEAKQGAGVVGAPALPVLLSVKSPYAKREVQVVDFKTDQLIYEYLPTHFLITVRNTGNIHVAPAGDIFIDSMLHNEIGVVPANKGRANVFPNSIRTFITSWEDGFIIRVPKIENDKALTDGKGNTVYETKYDFEKANKFRFGKYTANLVLIYDNGERDVPIEAQVSFWIIPWKIILGTLFIIILALFGLRAVLLSVFRKIKKMRTK